MQKIQLLIEDDFLEQFMESLPKDKVYVIEEDFQNNKELLKKAFQEYETNSSNFIPYNESMKLINNWLKEKEQS